MVHDGASPLSKVIGEEGGSAHSRYSLIIDGRVVEAVSGRRYDTIDPFTLGLLQA